LHVLHAVQQQYRHISDEAVNEVAVQLDLPVSQVNAVVEFYSFLSKTPRGRYDILFSNCTSCGDPDLMRLLCQRLDVIAGQTRADGLVSIDQTSCIGMCDHGASLLVNGRPIVRLDAAMIERIPVLIGAETPLSGWPAEWFRVDENIRASGMLLNAELPAGDSLRATLSRGADDALNGIIQSGLRGRGGAGFSTGMKWKFCREAPGDAHYVVCNADEGDPGAFMDRSVLEGDPHAVLEGMLIASYAIGAREGYLYVRSEYPLAVSTVTHAIRMAEARGLLGDDIFGSGHSFRVRVRRGAGAFVCGEETALIASIEGRSGEPRPRPPFPAVSGLWGKPTVINNVKTLSSAGPILSRGSAWYAGHGTERNRGTTVFALVGAVRNTGLVEIPLGLTLREMVMEIGGGIPGKRTLKGVQTGGPSGGCLPASMLDLPIDYERLGAAGSMMGSGGMIVLDAGTCMVDLARFFLTFTSDESCGKCTPCREGTAHMLRILTRICEGGGAPEDLDVLERLARTLKSASLCGLGGTAPNPVLTALRYFRDEFDAHILRKQCPAGVCRALIRFRIEEATCSGCGRCIEVCPVDAILGKPKTPHRIDEAVCTRCGACRAVCSTDAVVSQ